MFYRVSSFQNNIHAWYIHYAFVLRGSLFTGVLFCCFRCLCLLLLLLLLYVLQLAHSSLRVSIIKLCVCYSAISFLGRLLSFPLSLWGFQFYCRLLSFVCSRVLLRISLRTCHMIIRDGCFTFICLTSIVLCSFILQSYKVLPRSIHGVPPNYC